MHDFKNKASVHRSYYKIFKEFDCKIDYFLQFTRHNITTLGIKEAQGHRQRGDQGVACNPPFILMVFIEVCHAALLRPYYYGLLVPAEPQLLRDSQHCRSLYEKVEWLTAL